MIILILITPDYLVEVESVAIDVLVFGQYRCKGGGEVFQFFCQVGELFVEGLVLMG